MKLSMFLKTQSVARNSIYTMSSQIVINVASIFVAGYIATSLGDVDYGKFVFAFAFVQTLSSFSNMGIHVVQVREIAKDKLKAPEFFGSTLMFRVFFALLTYSVIACVISVADYPPVTKHIVYIAGLTLVFTYVTDSCIATFRAYEQMQFSAAIRLSTTIFSIFLRVMVIYLGYRLLVLSWTMAFISFVSALVPYYVIKKVFFRPKYIIDFKAFKHILTLTIPFYSMHVFMEAYKRLDVVLLSFFKGDAQVGWYNASAILVLRLAFIPSAISGAIFPVMSRLLATGNEEEALTAYRQGLLALFMLGIPIAIGLHILAEDVILLIYDDTFASSVLVLQILSFAIPMTYLSFHMQNALFSFGKERLVTKIIAFYALANLVLNLILIPRFGCLGAAISACISQMINFMLSFYFVTVLLRVRSFDLRFLSIIISGAIMGLALHFFCGTNLLLLLFIGSGSYFAALFALRVLTPRSINQLRTMVFDNQWT